MHTIGIVGLGLIGASMAKSAKKKTKVRVYGCDIDKSVVGYAQLSGIIDAELTSQNLCECDTVFVCLYPSDCVEYVRVNAEHFAKNALVIDCAGVKRSVCTPCYKEAAEKGFHFVGGHPMAGTQYSGIKNSKDTMFHNACFVLVPRHNEEVEVLARAREAVIEVGFSRVSVMSDERHDELIAYTSQLAHVVSNAYVKSPCAKAHKGISAGSYKDLTRVAYLNENMWTELFMDNRDNLLREINVLIENLTDYAKTLECGDRDKLRELLLEGKTAKQEAD